MQIFQSGNNEGWHVGGRLCGAEYIFAGWFRLGHGERSECSLRLITVVILKKVLIKNKKT